MATTTTTKSKGRKARDRDTVKQTIRQSLRSAFPEDTVDISDGYQGNIHVVVVSRLFDDMSEKEKQERLWELIEAADLTDAERELISLVYPVSVAELK